MPLTGLPPSLEQLAAGMGDDNSGFASFIVEQLAPIGTVACARFFGGLSLKCEGLLFAMIMRGSLYFAVDDLSRPEYESLGSRCFCYDTKSRRVDVRRFFEVPADVLEDSERLLGFARRAILAASARAQERTSRPSSRQRKPKVARPRVER
ncbi:MAG: TfoX/Sxy family protein [Rudaea sp.]